MPEIGGAIGVPIPSGLSLEEIRQCELFAKAAGFKSPLFDPTPSHSGRHGHNCPTCSRVLTAAAAEKARPAPAQPWEAKRAA